MRHRQAWVGVAALGALAMAGAAQAAVISAGSTTVANNAATRNTFYTVTVGVAGPESLVDFEADTFVDNAPLHGSTYDNGLTMNADPTKTFMVEAGAGAIGGSNPIGTKAAELADDAFLVLDFSARPVDYVSFYMIDATRTDVTITFVDNTTTTFETPGTGGSGEVALFAGVYRNDQPPIKLISFPEIGGTAPWGIDNIEYGVIPEPATATLLTTAAGLLATRRRRAER